MRSKPSAELPRLYRLYNRRYFNGRLPRKLTIIGFTGHQFPRRKLGQYLAPKDCVEFIPAKGNKVVYYGPIIMLRVDEPIMVVKSTLLHEMVHASGIYEHGPRFDREMLRLAKAGAFKGVW